MSTAPCPDFSPPIVNGVHEAVSHHARKGLLGVLRGRLTGGKIQSGDYYFSRTRTMIKEHYPGLPLKDQNTVHLRFERVLAVQEKLKNAQGAIEKYTRARDYKRVSKKTFIIVEDVSNRADTNNVMAQFSMGTGRGISPPPPPGPQRPSTPTPSTFTNPFGDSHAISTLSDMDLSNVDQVEMSRFESEPTGEAAVIMDLHDRDGTTREFVATFPLEAISGHRADQGAETASMSSCNTHRVYGPSEAGDNVGQ
ncbi:hypothetical protein V8E53_001538 [Lactarius tabidus]